VRHRRSAKPEQGIDVGLEDAVEVLGDDVLDALAAHLVSGIVDKHVDLADLLRGPLDQLPAVPLVTDIAGDGHAFPTLLLDRGLYLLSVGVLIEVGGTPGRKKSRASCPGKRISPENPDDWSATALTT
jgi:hypothetical protein